MSQHKQGIPLVPTNRTSQSAGNTAVKSVALATFKFLRASSAQASKLPGLLSQASTDIVEAWAESSPKQ
jgi:hypothetical protein